MGSDLSSGKTSRVAFAFDLAMASSKRDRLGGIVEEIFMEDVLLSSEDL